MSRLRGIDQEMEKQQSEYLALSSECTTAKRKVSALETAIKQLSANLQDADERCGKIVASHPKQHYFLVDTCALAIVLKVPRSSRTSPSSFTAGRQGPG